MNRSDLLCLRTNGWDNTIRIVLTANFDLIKIKPLILLKDILRWRKRFSSKDKILCLCGPNPFRKSVFNQLEIFLEYLRLIILCTCLFEKIFAFTLRTHVEDQTILLFINIHYFISLFLWKSDTQKKKKEVPSKYIFFL